MTMCKATFEDMEGLALKAHNLKRDEIETLRKVMEPFPSLYDTEIKAFAAGLAYARAESAETLSKKDELISELEQAMSACAERLRRVLK